MYLAPIKSVVDMQVGDIVTYGWQSEDANTYILDSIESSGSVLLRHPLSDVFLMRVPQKELNQFPAKIKGHNERGLDFVRQHDTMLDLETLREFQSLCFIYIHLREFLPKQKKALSDIMGRIASRLLRYDVNEAMALIEENVALLDEFNQMWYRNLRVLFDGTEPIKTEKQRKSLFNMAAFVLAEKQNPITMRMN